MKRVIVTGGTGFIGSALIRELLNEGIMVYAICRKASKNLNKLPASTGLILIEGNMELINDCENELRKYSNQYDAFFHLAWEGVGNKDRNDFIQFHNVEPTLNTLRLAHRLGCNRWIGTGSQAEYGPLNKKISETDSTHPTTMYGVAKLSSCLSALILGNQLNLDTKWVRVFSTYGPGDNSGWMLTDLIRNLLIDQQPKLTLGEQKWDYLYINDAARALVSLAKVGTNSSGIYNLGSGSSKTIRRIIESVRDIINPEFKLTFGELPYREDQVMHLEADMSKLMDLTGWEPQTDLYNGITNTVDYIKSLI